MVKSSAQHFDVPDKELRYAKQAMNAMIQSLKACSMFPLTHENCQKAINVAKKRLDIFLDQREALRIHINQNTVLYRETPIHKEEGGRGMFVAPLFRDGVEWVEFQKGIRKHEINGFISTLMQHRTLKADSEGDIVTTLWEENYPHLKYEAREAVWEAELANDALEDMSIQMNLPVETQGIASLLPGVDDDNVEDSQAEGEEGSEREAGGQTEAKGSAAPNLGDPAMDPTLWRLTDEEKEILREMVYEEENFESTGNVLDVLMILLKKDSETEEGEHRAKSVEDINSILSFLKEEFQTTLDQGQIRLAFKLLKDLSAIRSSIAMAEDRNADVVLLLNDFFMDISTPEVLAPLNLVWPRLEKLDPSQIKAFKEHILLLHPKAILAFAPAIIETQSSKARRAILEIIAIFAKKDTKPLDTILKNAEKKLILMLIDLLSRLNGDEFQQMLLDLMDNPSEAVRSKVLKVLLEKDPYMLWRLFNHIEDDSRIVAGVIHGYMGRSRDKMSESLMLDYLEEGQYKKDGRDHVMQCYKTLGRCGSDHSVEFLSDVLLGNDYKERYGGQLALHREGAAIALGRIGTTQACKILKKASRSLSSKIRQAAKKAMEDAK